jgi:DNA-directed RNA polymerase subunit RPC12/RpoP
MRVCPNCKTTVNPFRLILVTNVSAYRCPHCSQAFRRAMLPALIVYPLLACLLIALQAWLDLSLVAVMVAALPIAWLMDWLVMPWKRADASA